MKPLGLLLLCLLASAPAFAGEIALTFDDAPTPDSAVQTGAQRTSRLIELLQTAKVPAMFFVTTKHLDDTSRSRLTQYAKAGHYIANHSHAHLSADETPAGIFLKDVHRAHGELKNLPGFKPFFRFPFLHEGADPTGREALREGLDNLGYRNGYVTVDNFDWYINALYEQAIKEGKQVDAKRLSQLYVDTLWAGIEFYDRLARETLGRSPKHILLLHENDLAAAFVGDLVQHIRSQGWRIIDPLDAYADAIAIINTDLAFTKQGRIAALASAKGMQPNMLRHSSENTEEIDRLFERYRVVIPPGAEIP